jgi:PAS domain S-box-containing protein
MHARETDRKATAENKEISRRLRQIGRMLELALPHQRFDMNDSGIHDGPRPIDRLADSIEINQAIVASVTAIVVAEDGMIIGATAAADVLFGYAVGEMAGAGMSIHELVPPDRREAHREYFAEFWQQPSARQMGTREMTLEGIARDGTLFPVEVGWGAPVYVLGRRAVVASVMKLGKNHAVSGGSGIHDREDETQ